MSGPEPVSAAGSLLPEEVRVVRLSRRAMGTMFEVLLCGEDDAYLLSAAEEAFAEVERLEDALSVFRPSSEISRLNAHAARAPVRTERWIIELLQRAADLSAATESAFDFAMGALVDCWRQARKSGRPPDAQTVARALESSGARYVRLDDRANTVAFSRDGVAIDLSAIGKGYAVDVATGLLQELGIAAGLIHAGWSSVYALGAPPERSGWPVGVTHPLDAERRSGVLTLRDRALSVTADAEQRFEHQGRTYGHILDPRTGWPVSGMLCAAAVAKSATVADALSTAFFVQGAARAIEYCRRHPDVGALLVAGGDPGGELNVISCGLEGCLRAPERPDTQSHHPEDEPQ